jgi:hypothetical protein
MAVAFCLIGPALGLAIVGLMMMLGGGITINGLVFMLLGFGSVWLSYKLWPIPLDC